MTRIGVFYDGNYFAHVSNYYNYEHDRKSRLSISGLHEFIRNQVAEEEAVDPRFCHIVDSHYFRGRLGSHDVQEPNRIIAERLFDDILMYEGVVTHYLPLRQNQERKEEKGIDVWLALEAYEMAQYKNYQVLVLIACDSDYVPLVRKLNTLGVRVMVLGWDFEYTDERTGRLRKTVTSLELMKEATYPISMHELIDNKIKRDDMVIRNLFITKERRSQKNGLFRKPLPVGSVQQSTILSLKNGYGFIKMPPNNLYFHWTNVEDGDFNDLQEDDLVEFTIDKNDRGQEVAIQVRRLYEDDDFEENDDDDDYEEDEVYEDDFEGEEVD
jgi:uncharacterized LabA/DUF88 family protein/cold shock CspA family protein